MPTDGEGAVEPDSHDVAKKGSGDLKILAVGAGLGLAGKALGRGLHIVTQIALARLLGPAEFGLYALGWTLLRMSSILAPAGLDKGVIRFGAPWWPGEPGEVRDLIGSGTTLASLVGAVLGAGLFAGAPMLSQTVFDDPSLTPILRWFSAGFLLMGPFRVLSSGTRITRSVRFCMITDDVVQPGVNLIFVAGALALGWGVGGAAGATVGSFAVATLLASYFVHRLFPRQGTPSRDLGSWRPLLGYSLPTALAGVSAAYLLWMDRLYVGAFLSSTEVGVYQAASQISVVFSLVLAPFSAILAPMIPALYRDQASTRLGAVFSSSTRWVLYLSCPLFLLILMLNQHLIVTLFGAAYASGAAPLLILAAGQMAGVAGGAVGMMLIMTENERVWMVLSAASLILHGVLSVLLIPRFGISGAATATASALAVMSISGLLIVRSRLSLWPFDRRLLKGLAAALVAAGALWGLSSLFPPQSLLGLLLALVMNAAVFFAVLIALGLEPEERELLAHARDRFTSSR